MNKQRHVKYLELAEFIAKQNSTCVRRAVACILVRDNAIIATGYNGPPSGEAHPTCDTCVRIGIPSGQQLDKCCCTHAEANAIALAARDGHATAGATAYCTDACCLSCARILFRAGIEEVHFQKTYGDPQGLDFLTKKIRVFTHNGPKSP